MSNILEYKGYFTKVQYSSKDNVLHGKVEGIADLITFESYSCEEIESEFHAAVDDYLEFCQDIGKVPEKPYKGSFNIRISPELHKRADITAKKQSITLNQFVSDAIAEHLDGKNHTTVIYLPVKNQNWNINNATTGYIDQSMQKIKTREENILWKM